MTFPALLLVLYGIIGILVYLCTDTTRFAAMLERKCPFLSYSDVIRPMFPLVVILWPLWLVVNARFNR